MIEYLKICISYSDNKKIQLNNSKKAIELLIDSFCEFRKHKNLNLDMVQQVAQMIIALTRSFTSTGGKLSVFGDEEDSVIDQIVLKIHDESIGGNNDAKERLDDRLINHATSSTEYGIGNSTNEPSTKAQ